MGLAITFVVGALCVTVLVASYLLQPEVNGNVEQGNKARSLWRRKLSSLRHAVLKGSPLSAVSIMVVVLQIVIQVCALQTKITKHYVSCLVELGGSIRGSIELSSIGTC